MTACCRESSKCYAVVTLLNPTLEVRHHKRERIECCQGTSCSVSPTEAHGSCHAGSASVKSTYSNTVNSIKVTTSAQRDAPDPINVSFVRMLSSLALHCGEKTHQNTTISYSSRSLSLTVWEIYVNYCVCED